MMEREQPPSIRRRVEYLQRRGVARQRIGWFAPAVMVLAVILTVVFFLWLSAGCAGGSNAERVAQGGAVGELRTQIDQIAAIAVKTHNHVTGIKTIARNSRGIGGWELAAGFGVYWLSSGARDVLLAWFRRRRNNKTCVDTPPPPP